MSTGLIVLVMGLFVIFGSFVFGVINVTRMITGKSESSLTGVFSRHAGAIIGIASGSLMVVIGAIIMIVRYPK